MGQNIEVTLIGLNRWTASIGMALKAHSKQPNSRHTFTITGQDGDKAAMTAAQHFEAVDKLESNAKSAVRYADIVIVSLPAGVIEPVYEYFADALKAGTVVLDLSLGKLSALALADKYFPRQPNGQHQAYLVGIQPMVASPFLYDPRTNIEAADPKLFDNSEMIIAPSAACPEDAVKLASDLAVILNMNPRFLAPQEYEALASVTENLPTLLSLALFMSLKDGQGSEELQRLVNPALGLMLHNLRHADPTDLTTSWTQHALSTQQHIDRLIEMLEQLRELLSHNDGEEVKKMLRDVLANFQHWEKQRESGRWEVTSPVDKQPSLLVSWLGFGLMGRKKSS